MDWLEIVRYETTRKIIETVLAAEILNDATELNYSMLNTALECGRKDVADFFLNHNCVVNKSRSCKFHNTPLHNAVLLEDLRIVNILLEKKALIHAYNADNNTPLHLAFMKKNNELVDMLLATIESSGKYENVENKFGLTILHIACARNNTKIIENILKTDPNLKASVSSQSLMWKGFTAFHFAAEFKSFEAMKILLSVSNTVDREKRNDRGHTAVQMINENLANLLVISDLLSKDNHSKSYKGFSNFHVACAEGDPEIVRQYLDEGLPIDTPVSEEVEMCTHYTPLHFAVEKRSEENVKILMKSGADLNKKNNEGMTPLHLALYTEEMGKRSSLVDTIYRATKNKETNVTDENDLSYLHVACTRNDVNLVKQLLDQQADVNSKVTYDAKKFYHYTPLHFAVFYENVEMVRLLIDQGADVNACNGSHTGTPILMSFYCGNKILIDILLSNGADPKAVRPLDKETTLTCLVYGYIDRQDDDLLPYIERLILEFGVDVNAKDHEGDTALHIACENFGIGAPCAKLLLEFGADINAENDKGETPFVWAIHEPGNWDSSNADHYVMLYQHVQKLKALGVEINVKNERCCERLRDKRKIWKMDELSNDGLAFLELETSEEISRMKKMELLENLSLYDFIMMEPERAATYSIDDAVGLTVDTTMSVSNQFPIYGYLIRLQLRRINLAARNSETAVEIDRSRTVKRKRVK